MRFTAFSDLSLEPSALEVRKLARKFSWRCLDPMCAPLAFGGNIFGWTADEAMSFHIATAFYHILQ
jgi:hypothetical protein